jgi:hypothetical protein
MKLIFNVVRVYLKDNIEGHKEVAKIKHRN